LTHLKDPGFSVHASLSDIYAKRGDIAEAKSAYHRAMAADSQLDPVLPVQELDGVPIIFLHRGDADFFRVAQEQARLWNPKRRIIVIGDDYNRVDGIEYHRWADYRDGADALVEAYQHRTVNTFPFEILCLERWLVLRTFCKAHGLDEVIHLDSDVLVFESFDDSLPSLREKAAAVCGVQAGVAYFTYSELSIVSDTLMQVMGNPEQFEDFVICNDMDLIGRTARERGWHDLLVPVDDVVFDNHIHTSDGFDFEDGRKRFEFSDGQPYSNHAPSGVRMRFRAIHFQGSAKLLMADYVKRAHASM
ncbi:MAG: hypothetical protein VX834_00235, partial [Myxococcota bacterium]|nr:hypothetical protein [Myxococcota bacterium]